MKFTPTTLSDVILIEPQVFKDDRGFFFESYRRQIFVDNGIRVEFVQDNHSRSAKGALRGLHFQTPPHEQAKLIGVVRGEIFDVVVDARKGSKTYGKHVTLTLSAENRKMVYIPAGFAHGFLSMAEGTEVLYKVSDIYSPSHERGIRWDDPALAIAWPKLNVPYVFSEKDKHFPSLKEI